MARRKTLGHDPLESVVSGEEETEDVEQPEEERSYDPDAKSRITFNLTNELIERMKNAVYATPHERLTHFAERALWQELLEKEKENGGPFPERKGNLPPGRPME